jgi:sialic acid synthase SpsE
MAESGKNANAVVDCHQDHPADSIRFYAKQLNALADVFSLGIGQSDAQECYLREAIAVAHDAAGCLRRKARDWGLTSC